MCLLFHFVFPYCTFDVIMCYIIKRVGNLMGIMEMFPLA